MNSILRIQLRFPADSEQGSELKGFKNIYIEPTKNLFYFLSRWRIINTRYQHDTNMSGSGPVSRCSDRKTQFVALHEEMRVTGGWEDRIRIKNYNINFCG